MSFKTDKQTLNDLNIFGRPGMTSVYNLFNNTNTRGGAQILEQMFLYPLNDAQAINDRSARFRYFMGLKMKFPFSTEMLDSAEIYLAMTDERTRLTHDNDTISRKIGNLLTSDGDQKVIYNGLNAIISLMHQLKDLLAGLSVSALGGPYQQDVESLSLIMQEPVIADLLSDKQKSKLSHTEMAHYDSLLRFTYRFKVKQILGYIYYLDVYLTVADTAMNNQMAFPVALAGPDHSVKLTGISHPLIRNAVANSIDITPKSNVVFLTGANMAGKSTFMKTIGIALYLAHMGFPVAAQKMEFSVMDGMYTTINLPDDLSSGNSHFYAEVLRLKKIAKEVGANKKLFIIFDELFRGTNVKDAYEGTIAITGAFAQKRNCMFVVSTHIIEAGEVLGQQCNNINFVYLPTRMAGNTPVYTYKLEQGITADWHGMVIINNERILEILSSRKTKNNLS